jgi:hypothetical protein
MKQSTTVQRCRPLSVERTMMRMKHVSLLASMALGVTWLYFGVASAKTTDPCFAHTELAGRSSVKFVVGCRSKFAVSRAYVTPSIDNRGFWRHMTIHNRHDPRERMSCNGGKHKLRCHGWIRTRTVAAGRFNVARSVRCDVQVKFLLYGATDCDPGSNCRGTGMRGSVVDRKPRGCS